MSLPRPHATAGKALFLGLLVLAADQAAKLSVEHYLGLWEGVEVIPGLFNLVHFRNRGVAFGLLDSTNLAWQNAFLITIICLALCLILYMLFTSRERDVWFCYGLGAIAGGAVGNLVDRIRLGMVVDYLDFYLGQAHWPAFNLADAAISLGVAAVLASLILER